MEKKKEKSYEKGEEWTGQRAQEKPEHLAGDDSWPYRYMHMHIHRFMLIRAGMHCVHHSSMQETAVKTQSGDYLTRRVTSLSQSQSTEKLVHHSSG